MTLNVETGTGAANSESYVSIADANAYAVARGLLFPITAPELAEQALRRATTWLDATYGGYFSGDRMNGRSQTLQWPRSSAYDNSGTPIGLPSDEVPIEIINATIEAAVREMASPGALSPDITPGQIKEEVAVAGAVSVKYAKGQGVSGQMPIVTVIDNILGSLISISHGAALFGKLERV
ncbi:MAG: hypothetical protein COB78_10875 [Hyphomicrobiales bacterium]|nr:MAG: hypothetical protein COB78_10875 [Hyphomicrobiales bacterium]